MYLIRLATLGDSEVITEHRKQMFLDMGKPQDTRMLEMLAAFRPWVEQALQSGEYMGWLITAGESVVASLGLMFTNAAPRLQDVGTVRGYIFNVYTQPAHRRRGLAGQMVSAALEECRARDIGLVALHASEDGRSLYESLGFKASNEMVWGAEG